MAMKTMKTMKAAMKQPKAAMKQGKTAMKKAMKQGKTAMKKQTLTESWVTSDTTNVQRIWSVANWNEKTKTMTHEILHKDRHAKQVMF